MEDLGYCRMSVGIITVICQMTLQFKLLYELINHVTNCYYDVCRRSAVAKIFDLFQLGKDS